VERKTKEVNSMKHIKALSKLDPKMAFSLDFLKGGKKSECDTLLKTPDEKAESKNDNGS
jgi:hypothetical protein